MRSYFVKVPRFAKLAYPNAIWGRKTDEGRQIPMLTIDDGPHPESTRLWMDVLETHELRGLFFFRGDHSSLYPELVQETRARGHMVGSHGFLHLNGWRTSTPDYLTDVRRSLDLLETEYFRPPYGKLRWSQYYEVSKISTLVMWSYMPGDFDENVRPDDISSRMEGIGPDDIIVVHDRLGCYHKFHHVWSEGSFVDKIQKFI